MEKNRLEAFSDGVIAILITIMVLEFKVPHGSDVAALAPLWPTLVSYVLSFVFLAIYWNNHHHLLQAAHQVNGRVLWANTHLLFWLSLVPFTTAWMGENHFETQTVAVYGFVLFMSGVAFSGLARSLVKHHGPESRIARSRRDSSKGNASLLAYGAAIPLAFVNRWVSIAIYAGVAVAWWVPDRRIEQVLAKRD